MAYYPDGLWHSHSDDDHGDEYDDDDDEDMSENSDYFVDCDYCSSKVLESNYKNHLEKVHKCTYCRNFMPKESIKRHIQEKHMEKCSYCNAVMLESKIDQHMLTHNNNNNNRPLDGAIGMIQLGKLNDERFNKLISENRVYAKDGQLFIK